MNTDTPLSKKTNPPSTHLARRVVEEIKQTHTVPRPRWTYLFINRAWWAAALLALLVAAAAAAAVIFIFANAGWQYAPATHGSVFTLLAAIVPNIWLFALIIFALVGYWNIRHTARGYRYSPSLVAVGIILLAVLAGGTLFAAGWGQEVEEGLGRHLPFYRPFLDEEHSWWLNAHKGLLVGTVTSLAPDFSSFILRTSSGRTLTIDAHDLRLADISVLARGGTVRVVGVPYAATSTAPFHACFVFPWEIYGAPSSPSLPLAVLSSSTREIIPSGARSSLCKGVRPYRQLRALQETQ